MDPSSDQNQPYFDQTAPLGQTDPLRSQMKVITIDLLSIHTKTPVPWYHELWEELFPLENKELCEVTQYYTKPDMVHFLSAGIGRVVCTITPDKDISFSDSIFNDFIILNTTCEPIQPSEPGEPGEPNYPNGVFYCGVSYRLLMNVYILPDWYDVLTEKDHGCISENAASFLTELGNNLYNSNYPTANRILLTAKPKMGQEKEIITTLSIGDEVICSHPDFADILPKYNWSIYYPYDDGLIFEVPFIEQIEQKKGWYDWLMSWVR